MDGFERSDTIEQIIWSTNSDISTEEFNSNMHDLKNIEHMLKVKTVGRIIEIELLEDDYGTTVSCKLLDGLISNIIHKELSPEISVEIVAQDGDLKIISHRHNQKKILIYREVREDKISKTSDIRNIICKDTSENSLNKYTKTLLPMVLNLLSNSVHSA